MRYIAGQRYTVNRIKASTISTCVLSALQSYPRFNKTIPMRFKFMQHAVLIPYPGTLLAGRFYTNNTDSGM